MIEIDDKQFQESLNLICGTHEGRVVMAYIADWCGYARPKIGNTLEATYANANVERLYLMLRDKIKPEHLKEIEFDYKRKAVTNGRRTATTTSGKPSDNG